MKNMNKLFLMSALLLAANSTSYLAGTTCGKNEMRLKLYNDTNTALTAHFEKPLPNGKTHEDVKANNSETVTVGNEWLNNRVVVTWKTVNGEEKDKDTVRFTEIGQELTSSPNDNNKDGHPDNLG